jgi:small-conductance mechanosensitive channel
VIASSFVRALLDALTSPNQDVPDATAGVSALAHHMGERWQFLLMAALIVSFAAVVNRYAPTKRKRIRRTLILFAFYLFFWLVSATFGAAHAQAWDDRFHVAADLCEMLIVVNLAALAVFELVLPAVRLSVATIASDLFVGFAYIVGTIVVLRGDGVEPGSVVATSAVVSGVLALSLQTTLGNILGGVALQLDHSVHEGDWIQLPDGTQGKVKAIHWRHTVVETRNWDTVIVPNSNLLAANIVILGKRVGQPLQHRMWVYFNVDFRYPPAKIIQIVTDALLAAPIERVASDPPANVICYDFAAAGRDSFAYYAVRYWLTDLAVDDPTNSAVRERVYAALRRADIPLARPAATTFFARDDRGDVELRARHHRAERAALLASVDLFKPLTNEEREYLADHLVYAPFARGETLTHQGAVAHWLYIVVKGKADIRVHIEGTTRTLAHIEGPAVCGEMGLMTGEPRTADVVATTDVECYRLDKTGFQKVIAERREVAEEMSKIMARRRIELASARDGVAPESRSGDESPEAARILNKIRNFFGIDAAA